MARPDERLFSLDDLYGLPDDGWRYELSHGRLVSEPPPGGRHGRVAVQIVAALHHHARKHGLGVVMTCDTGFVLARDPATLRAPDVSFVSRERYLALRDDAMPIPGPPDLAVEVLSPGDRAGRVAAKISDYLTAGTRLVWIVDPKTRTVRVHRPGATPTRLNETDQLTATDVLPGFCILVGDLFLI